MSETHERLGDHGAAVSTRFVPRLAAAHANASAERVDEIHPEASGKFTTIRHVAPAAHA
ncbi:hypothetical protein [Comamonas sp. BIGb0124]|uniref:hypothetical protein n=1 Tax=Comamonas sp. BIGb0124 TaxID=2485130 RepID=UPI0013153DFE|nr:hypothetical protein [Comamonas sp. BIGb0124]